VEAETTRSGLSSPFTTFGGVVFLVGSLLFFFFFFFFVVSCLVFVFVFFVERVTHP